MTMRFSLRASKEICFRAWNEFVWLRTGISNGLL